VRAATQYIIRITGAEGPLELEDAIELLAGHPKHPQGILGAVRDELSVALAEVKRLEGEMWLAGSVRDESVRELDEARQEVVGARRAVLLRSRLGGMLALRTEDEIFLHVEDMATRDRAAWAASSDNAINLGRLLTDVTRERDEARTRAADDLSGALGAAHSREMTQRHRAETAEHERDALTRQMAAIDAAHPGNKPSVSAMAAALAAMTAERDALTRQMALRRELQAETDDAVRKCKQLGEACACVAQEEAHKWDLASLRANEEDYDASENEKWARTHARVARDIEAKIRALLEAK
jgi:hypothetical protein